MSPYHASWMQEGNCGLNRKNKSGNYLLKAYIFFRYISLNPSVPHHPRWAFSSLWTSAGCIKSLSPPAHHELFGQMLNANAVFTLSRLPGPTPHSTFSTLAFVCFNWAAPPPSLHLMACLILIETELALEVKYILMHCANPFIKRNVKTVESCKIASIN